MDGGGPKPKDRVLKRQRRGETGTQRRSHVKTEAEREGGSHQPRDGRLEPPEAGRGGEDPPLEPLQGARPWDTLTSDIRFQSPAD